MRMWRNENGAKWQWGETGRGKVMKGQSDEGAK
jgi:hypothetical protein